MNPGTVARWLEALPPGAVEADARLCLARGWAALFTGRLEEVEPVIEAAERNPLPGPPATRSARSRRRPRCCAPCIAYLRGDVGRAHAMAVEAPGRRRAERRRWRA